MSFLMGMPLFVDSVSDRHYPAYGVATKVGPPYRWPSCQAPTALPLAARQMLPSTNSTSNESPAPRQGLARSSVRSPTKGLTNIGVVPVAGRMVVVSESLKAKKPLN